MKLSDDEIVIELGKRMKIIRKSKGMTQFDVADKSKMEESAYRRVENAKTSPTLKTLLAISRAMEIDIVELFDFIR